METVVLGSLEVSVLVCYFNLALEYSILMVVLGNRRFGSSCVFANVGRLSEVKVSCGRTSKTFFLVCSTRNPCYDIPWLH